VAQKSRMEDKPYITYIRRLTRLQDRRMESRLSRSYQTLAKMLPQWLRKRGVGDLGEAEDVAQSVWIELLLGVRTRRISEWSDGIVFHHANFRLLDYLRQRRIRGRVVDMTSVEREVSDEFADPDLLITLEQLMGRLHLIERQTVQELYLNGRTITETAEEIGVSISTVKRSHRSAIETMRLQVS
jgi:RNA polymerase sigma factor (sigma-70 family)